MACPLSNNQINQILSTDIVTVEEVRGGISKLVFKIITDVEIYMLYIWLRPFEGELTENKTIGANYLFADGFKYFLHNTKILTDIGIKVPQIIRFGHDLAGDFDYAIVEFLHGKSFQEYIDNGGDLSIYSKKMNVMMDKMASSSREYYGSPLDTSSFYLPPEQLVYNFYSEELRIASELDNEIMDSVEDILKLMKNMLERIDPDEKPVYSLIHGELTPPHIFILENNELAIIDIEAVKYFDFEYDWAVINIMYGDEIPLPKSLNHQKLEYYSVCLKVGYISVAADYLAHVDTGNEFFKSIRQSNLLELKNLYN